MTTLFRKGPASQIRRPLISQLTAGLSGRFPMKKNKFHAKDASWCPRKASLLMQIDAELLADFSPSGAFYMDIGTAVHETLCRGFERSGVLQLKEMRIDHLGLGIGGFADAIILVDDTNRVTEFKTCGTLPAAPKPDHVAQVTLYSLATGLRNPMLLYLSRSVANFSGELIVKEFEVNPTDSDYFTMAYGIAFAYYCTQAGFIPGIPSTITKSKCNYCPFTNFCWGVEDLGMKEAASSDRYEEFKALAQAHAEKIMREIDLRKAETEEKILCAKSAS